MPIIISKNKIEAGLFNAIKEISGVDVAGCLQCKKCTNGCPVATLVKVPPSEIIRRLQLNEDDSILSSDLVWMCASCNTCFSRCPMQIDMAAVMDALRIISIRKNIAKQKGNIPLFNKWFLRMVNIFGRTFDLGTIAVYKIGTSSYLQDADKFPMMLQKRKIALFPSFKADKKYVTRIFKKKK
ncbi:MAG: 4Fe-4S dicluster domain-containing protein [Bacteroidota bacterium]